MFTIKDILETMNSLTTKEVTAVNSKFFYFREKDEEFEHLMHRLTHDSLLKYMAKFNAIPKSFKKVIALDDEFMRNRAGRLDPNMNVHNKLFDTFRDSVRSKLEQDYGDDLTLGDGVQNMLDLCTSNDKKENINLKNYIKHIKKMMDKETSHLSVDVRLRVLRALTRFAYINDKSKGDLQNPLKEILLNGMTSGYRGIYGNDGSITDHYSCWEGFEERFLDDIYALTAEDSPTDLNAIESYAKRLLTGYDSGEGNHLLISALWHVLEMSEYTLKKETIEHQKLMYDNVILKEDDYQLWQKAVAAWQSHHYGDDVILGYIEAIKDLILETPSDHELRQHYDDYRKKNSMLPEKRALKGFINIYLGADVILDQNVLHYEKRDKSSTSDEIVYKQFELNDAAIKDRLSDYFRNKSSNMIKAMMNEDDGAPKKDINIQGFSYSDPIGMVIKTPYKDNKPYPLDELIEEQQIKFYEAVQKNNGEELLSKVADKARLSVDQIRCALFKSSEHAVNPIHSIYNNLEMIVNTGDREAPYSSEELSEKVNKDFSERQEMVKDIFTFIEGDTNGAFPMLDLSMYTPDIILSIWEIPGAVTKREYFKQKDRVLYSCETLDHVMLNTRVHLGPECIKSLGDSDGLSVKESNMTDEQFRTIYYIAYKYALVNTFRYLSEHYPNKLSGYIVDHKPSFHGYAGGMGFYQTYSCETMIAMLKVIKQAVMQSDIDDKNAELQKLFRRLYLSNQETSPIKSRDLIQYLLGEFNVYRADPNCRFTFMHYWLFPGLYKKNELTELVTTLSENLPKEFFESKKCFELLLKLYHFNASLDDILRYQDDALKSRNNFVDKRLSDLGLNRLDLVKIIFKKIPENCRYIKTAFKITAIYMALAHNYRSDRFNVSLDSFKELLSIDGDINANGALMIKHPDLSRIIDTLLKETCYYPAYYKGNGPFEIEYDPIEKLLKRNDAPKIVHHPTEKLLDGGVLAYAIANDQPDHIKLLLENDADIFSYDHQGCNRIGIYMDYYACNPVGIYMDYYACNPGYSYKLKYYERFLNFARHYKLDLNYRDERGDTFIDHWKAFNDKFPGVMLEQMGGRRFYGTLKYWPNVLWSNLRVICNRMFNAPHLSDYDDFLQPKILCWEDLLNPKISKEQYRKNIENTTISFNGLVKLWIKADVSQCDYDEDFVFDLLKSKGLDACPIDALAWSIRLIPMEWDTTPEEKEVAEAKFIKLLELYVDKVCNISPNSDRDNMKVIHVLFNHCLVKDDMFRTKDDRDRHRYEWFRKLLEDKFINQIQPEKLAFNTSFQYIYDRAEYFNEARNIYDRDEYFMPSVERVSCCYYFADNFPCDFITIVSLIKQWPQHHSKKNQKEIDRILWYVCSRNFKHSDKRLVLASMLINRGASPTTKFWSNYLRCDCSAIDHAYYIRDIKLLKMLFDSLDLKIDKKDVADLVGGIYGIREGIYRWDVYYKQIDYTVKMFNAVYQLYFADNTVDQVRYVNEIQEIGLDVLTATQIKRLFDSIETTSSEVKDQIDHILSSKSVFNKLGSERQFEYIKRIMNSVNMTDQHIQRVIDFGSTIDKVKPDLLAKIIDETEKESASKTMDDLKSFVETQCDGKIMGSIKDTSLLWRRPNRETPRGFEGSKGPERKK